jgi:hypothetical protein
MNISFSGLFDGVDTFGVSPARAQCREAPRSQRTPA